MSVCLTSKQPGITCLRSCRQMKSNAALPPFGMSGFARFAVRAGLRNLHFDAKASSMANESSSDPLWAKLFFGFYVTGYSFSLHSAPSLP